ncbi:MAG TPA: response regulator [Pyrinomonadaceae bacterium]|nr:response regulator [Pyrinomonadaceae bacterium]
MSHTSILYVEDYEQVLLTVKQLLELEGWTVEICRDAEAALALLEGGARFDVIVLDAKLGQMSGLELLRRARLLVGCERTPVIMFTATDCEEEASQAGANAFLRKPSGIRDLVATVERLLLDPGRDDFNSDFTPPSDAR